MRTPDEIFRLLLAEVNRQAKRRRIAPAVLACTYLPSGGPVFRLEYASLNEELTPDAPAAIALRARMESWLLRGNHETTERGYKVLAGAQQGHETVHGSADQKAARWEEFQNEVNALHKRNPNLSWTDIKKKAAKHFDVSEKTIQRRTTNPIKK